nr:calcium-binding protein [Methylobacterium sp. Leaf399]
MSKLKPSYFNEAYALTGTALNLIDIIPGVEIPPGILDVFNVLNDDPTLDLLNEMGEKLDAIYEQGEKILGELDEGQRLTHETILLNIRSSAKNAQEQLKIYTDAGGGSDARSEALRNSAKALGDAQEYAQSNLADAALAIPALLSAIAARVNVIQEIGDGATSGEFKGEVIGNSGTGLAGAIRTLEKSVQTYKEQLPDLIKYQADVTFDVDGINPSYLIQLYIVDGPEKRHIGNDVVYADATKYPDADVSALAGYINFESGNYTDFNQEGNTTYVTRSGMDVTDITGLTNFVRKYDHIGDQSILETTKEYLQYYIYPEAHQMELEAAVDALKQLVSGQHVKDADGTKDSTIQALSNIPDTFEKWPGFTAPHTLEGRAGNDTVIGSGGNDALRGGGGSVDYSIYGAVGDGNDHLHGKGGDDIIIAGTGNDWLDGGEGNDRMDGGAGIDMASYASATAGVTVSLDLQDWQETGFGKDRLLSIENLEGSNFGDKLTGSVANNTIYGLAGNDTIDGHQGADRMYGGAGNDTYFVDQSGDLVFEAANAGIDTIRSSVSFILAANVENLTLTGTAANSGTGNSLANVINGNAGANVLNGMGGVDTMSGGAGSDTYYVDNVGAWQRWRQRPQRDGWCRYNVRRGGLGHLLRRQRRRQSRRGHRRCRHRSRLRLGVVLAGWLGSGEPDPDRHRQSQWDRQLHRQHPHRQRTRWVARIWRA